MRSKREVNRVNIMLQTLEDAQVLAARVVRPSSAFSMIPVELVLYIFRLAVHSRYLLACVCKSWRIAILRDAPLWHSVWSGPHQASDLKALTFVLAHKASSWFVSRHGVIVTPLGAPARTFETQHTQALPISGDFAEGRLHATLAYFAHSVTSVAVTTAGWPRFLSMSHAIAGRVYPELRFLTIVITSPCTAILRFRAGRINCPAVVRVRILSAAREEHPCIEGVLSCCVYDDMDIPAGTVVHAQRNIVQTLWPAHMRYQRRLLRDVILHSLDSHLEEQILRGEVVTPLGTRLLLVCSATSPRPRGLDGLWTSPSFVAATLAACRRMITQCAPDWADGKCAFSVLGYCTERLQRRELCVHGQKLLDALEVVLDGQADLQAGQSDLDLYCGHLPLTCDEVRSPEMVYLLASRSSDSPCVAVATCSRQHQAHLRHDRTADLVGRHTDRSRGPGTVSSQRSGQWQYSLAASALSCSSFGGPRS